MWRTAPVRRLPVGFLEISTRKQQDVTASQAKDGAAAADGRSRAVTSRL